MKFSIRVAAIIMKDSKILVTGIKRKDKITYVLPGGGLEIKEDIFQAIKREVKEETFLDIDGLEIKYLKELYADESHSIDFYFVPKKVIGDIGIGEDPEYKENPVLFDVRYVSFEELKKLNFHPRQLISRIEQDYKNDFNNDIIHLGLYEYPEK